MLPRHTIERKYRPGLEALERKQLLSSGPRTYNPPPFDQAAPRVSSFAEHETADACGTGTGIRIITS
jgi:hypothetical protein